MRSGGPCPLVSLHEIKLRAPVAIDLVGIAVAEAISVHPEIACPVDARHLDKIESRNTAAPVPAEIDVPFEATSKKVRLEVLRVCLVKSRRL